jgi:class I fructose-bisphosphate aldolase
MWLPTRRRSRRSRAHVISEAADPGHEQAEAKKAYGRPRYRSTLAERCATWSSRRFRTAHRHSRAAHRENDDALYDEYRAIRDGGGFGSIIGRNSFQRAKPRALEFLSTVMKIYSGELK